MRPTCQDILRLQCGTALLMMFFAVYCGNEQNFKDFFDLLNSFDPYIKFTCERSRTGVECGFGSEVVEVLPFLDVMVTRHLDRTSETLSNKLAIYRKPCHSGSYIHFLSCKPMSTKRSVIRSLFLRAFRYCDAVLIKPGYLPRMAVTMR